jgi:hypothetical protein
MLLPSNDTSTLSTTTPALKLPSSLPPTPPAPVAPVSAAPTSSAPIQMTRAEYQAKYGVAPAVPPASSAPVSMTTAQYQAKYGQNPDGSPLSDKDTINANYHSGKINAADTVIQDVGQAAKDVTDATVNSPISPLNFLPKAAGWLASKTIDPLASLFGTGLRNIVGGNNADNIGNAAINGGKAFIEGNPGSQQNRIFQGLKRTYTAPGTAGDLAAVGNVSSLAGAAAGVGEGMGALDAVATPTADTLSTNEGIANIANQEKGIVPPAKTPAQTTAETQQQTWNVIKPKLSANDMTSAASNGSIVRTGEMGTVTQVPTASDLSDIKLAQPYVEAAKGDPLQTTVNIKQGIADEATQLRNAVGTQGGTFSTANIKGVLNEVKVPLAIKGTAEMAAVNNINEYVTNLADEVQKNPSGALDLSQKFRQGINSEFGENIWGKGTPISTYVRNVNQALNGFISQLLPDGVLPDGTSIKDSFARQSQLYNILENIQLPKVGDSLINPTEAKPLKLPGSPMSESIKQFTKDNPIAAGVAKSTVKIVGLGGAIHLIP